MELIENYSTIELSDGTSMQVFSAYPKGEGPFKALLIFQEAFGVNNHIRNVVRRFAQAGYLCMAPELFHRTVPPGTEFGYTDFASVGPHLGALTQEGLTVDITACWKWMAGHPKVNRELIACMGFCMGGRVAFLANSLFPFKAAISYYGGRIAPDLLPLAANLHGPMLFFWGGLDKHIPQEQIQQVIGALRKEGKPHINVEISYADHGFSCDERASYNAQAAAEAKATTLAFLENHLC